MKGARYALVLLIGGAILSPAVAGARPLDTAATQAACHGDPAPVHAQADGSGVRAGKVIVHCAGAWTMFQGVMHYENGTGQQYGKWSYGGTRYVSGRGDSVVGPWLRPYHGEGFWKQRVIIGGVQTDSAVTWFRS